MRAWIAVPHRPAAEPIDTRADPGADALLVQRCRAGDDAAWYVLVARHERYVLGICVQVYRLGGTDAEDVFQEAWARAFEHLDRLRDPSAFRAWMAELTRRLCVDRLRSHRREDLSELIDIGAEVDQRLEQLVEAASVREALTALPEHCQEILD